MTRPKDFHRNDEKSPPREQPTLREDLENEKSSQKGQQIPGADGPLGAGAEEDKNE